jgi:predicted PurR-regulated permease PerM
VIVPAALAFNNFITIAVVIATLYFSREILVPIALAVLLSFVLTPLVRLLQRWHFPRALAVVFAVAGALAVTVTLTTMVMVQVNQLARDNHGVSEVSTTSNRALTLGPISGMSR